MEISMPEGPTVRLQVIAATRGVRPVEVVLPGRQRRAGEQGYARLGRQPRRLMARRKSLRRLHVERWAVGYAVALAGGVVLGVVAVALVIGLVVEGAWVIGAVLGGLQALVRALVP